MAQTPGKITVSENQRTQEKDHPCNVESLPSARIHKNSYNLFKHVQFQEVKGLPSNMPASYHWEPPASTLAHCLAVIHPKNPDVLAKGCLACRRQSHLQTPSTSPTPGQRCADSTTRLPKWQIPTFSPWVERDFARPHLPKNKLAQTPGKITVSENQRSQEKDHPCNVESLPSARTHTIYSNMSSLKK